MENEENEEDKMLEKELENIQSNPNFIKMETLIKREAKLIEIFKKFKNKLTEPKIGLFLHPKEYNFQSSDYKQYFIYKKSFPLNEKKEFSFIYDCLNFMSYKKEDENKGCNKEIYVKKINELFSISKEKGIIIILLDQFNLEFFFPNLLSALGDNYKTKLFINFYFIDYHDYLFVVTIQKMSTSDKPLDLEETKVLITDYFSNLSPKMITSTKLGDINYYLTQQVSKMQTYHLQTTLNYSRLHDLHPGENMEMYLKTSPLNSEITYIVTIYDYSQNMDKKNKRCFSVAIGYQIIQELIFVKNYSYDYICQQLNAGRLIILEPSILNPINVNEMGFELNDEIQLMRPDGFDDQVIIKVWDDENPKTVIYKDDYFLIRDNEDKQFVLRQLLFVNEKHLENVVQSRIRIKFSSKTNVTNPQKGMVYYPMETQIKIKNKGVIECVDELNLFGYYEKCILCMAFFIEIEELPEVTVKILDIGAGIGTISFYFYRLFKGCCEIDNIEKDKRIYELGKKYFGLRDYDLYGNRVRFFFEDAESCIRKMIGYNNKTEKKYANKIDYYDLIINEINDINPKEETTPSKTYFSDKFLENITNLLTSNGVYIVNVMSKNYKGIYDIFVKLEEFFPSIFSIPTQNRLCSIFLCFNSKIDMEQYQDIFENNKEIIERNDVVELALINPIKNEVISKIICMDDEEKKKLEDNSKKY